jgi:formylglycine-generating enzyme required for sulfatase activity
MRPLPSRSGLANVCRQDEWEAAARGADGRAFPWGDEFDVTRANLRPSLTDRSPPVCAVDERNDDVSPFSVLHLVGNVREWVFDPWVARVADLPQEPWQYPTGHRVLKGSSVQAPPSPVGCRSSARTYGSPDKLPPGVGFRCAKSARP